MAYCKTCGNPLKDDAKRCKTCGSEIEQLETVHDSQVEIIHQRNAKRKRAFRFKNEDCPEEVLVNTYRVFDRKVLLLMLVLIAVFMLSFFAEALDGKDYSLSNTIQSFCVAAGLAVFMLGFILRNRGLLMLGLLILSVALCACSVVTAVFFKTESVNAVVLTCMQSFLQFVLASFTFSMFLEMLTGRRVLGLHCILAITASVATLGHITLSLVVNINKDVGVILTIWQILAVSAKIMLLSTVLVLFANMAHIGVHESY